MTRKRTNMVIIRSAQPTAQWMGAGWGIRKGDSRLSGLIRDP
jgi:hypothetical protein